MEYYDPFVVVDGVTPLSSPGGGMSIWADSEHNAPLPAKCVSLEYFFSNGTAASASPEVHLIPNGKLLPSKATRIGSVKFVPPVDHIGDVLMVRLSLWGRSSGGLCGKEKKQGPAASPLAQHTYAFGLKAPGTNSMNVRGPLRPLLNAPPTELTLKASKVNGSIALDVRVAGTSAALYVTLSLRSKATSKQLPWVSFSRNAFTLRANEATSVTAVTLMPMRDEGIQACAEAWNAPRTCV